MGDDSNEWHRDLVRPGVTALLDPHPGERILDLACGTGSLTLLDISQGSEEILFGHVGSDQPACTFSNLTASRLYQLAWDGPADCLLTVSDG